MDGKTVGLLIQAWIKERKSSYDFRKSNMIYDSLAKPLSKIVSGIYRSNRQI